MWPNSNLNAVLLILAVLACPTSSQHVPLAMANSTSNQVPTDPGFMPLQQSPGSVFFVHHNQQNAMQLRHSMEGKLRNIRNTELRVAKIQVGYQYCTSY